jgi:proliferating cell nuclear antigen PCNA
MAEIRSKKKKTKGPEKNDNRILEVQTTQTAALKQVIERIQSVVSETCITFIPPDNTDDTEIDDEYESEEEESKPQKKQKEKGKSKRKKVDSSEESNEEKKKRKPKKGKKAEEDSEEEDPKKKTTKPKTPPTPDKKRNTGGIRILRLTQDKSVLIKLSLDANNFEIFKCLEPKITIGIDMSQLHSMLKSISDNDPITLYMNRDNRNTLYIHSTCESENGAETEETDLEICLMEINNLDVPLPRAEFENRITMAADKFHTICKNLNNNSVHVGITSVDNEISFTGKSDAGKISRTYKDPNPKRKDKHHIVQGVYELKNLMYFSKCNKLCPTIDIYLKNDFPLVLVISVASLGKMYIFLTPADQDVGT